MANSPCRHTNIKMKSDKIIPFPVKPVPPKAELDGGEPQNIIVVEFDRDEYIVTASPAAL